MADLYLQELEEYTKTWNVKDHEKVNPSEKFWVAHYKWLHSYGYLLRPRYSPDWVPSWKGTEKDFYFFEDGQWLRSSHIMDATRISDGATVTLKMVFKSEHPFEDEINRILSSQPLANERGNRCIPTYEILEVPGYAGMQLFVMQFLRQYNDPRFETVGEAVEFFRQIFEGLQFMHKHHIAHRDCFGRNIMMDATDLYPNGYHPIRISKNRDYRGYAKHFTRTERPPKYFLIDFGLSRRYDPKDGPPLEIPIRGGDKSVPEFQGDGVYEPCDPFPTDVYYLGNMVKEDFLDANFGFEFMLPLVTDMIQDDPSKRPTMDEVVARFGPISQSLSTSKLRSRAMQRKEDPLLRGWRNTVHFFRRVRFTLQRIPPTSRPSTVV